MIRTTLPLLVVSAALAVVPASAASAADAPDHALVVKGAGVSTYPAFDPAIGRYAATTTAATNGALTVTASTTDPAGRIWIDGVRDADGTATVKGLADGDEVSVIIEDSAGRAVHSVVYLPADFPALEVTTQEAGRAPGHVFITPNRFSADSDTYEAAVDENGVPVFVHANRDAYSSTFKPTGHGGYTVFRDQALESPAGSRLLELDEAFRPVRELRNVSVDHTDGHDVVMKADGSRIMVGYPKRANGVVDNVIEEVDAAGKVVHRWSTADHFNPVSPELTGAARQAAVDKTDTMNPYTGDTDLTTGKMLLDYAHADSLDLVDGGQNLLVSFRNTSSVVKIAWAADRTDGRQQGEIIWRLGGRFSDFDFVDDPYAGPCGQYSARQLENGNVLVFDNGSPAATSGLFADTALCPDPADPTGPAVGRTFTRVTEYALDETAGTATLVWDYKPAVEAGKPDWFAFIAGGAEPLANGNYLISWGSARTQIVTEVEPAAKKVVWEMRDAAKHGLPSPFFSHRAVKSVVPDKIAPKVLFEGPADGAVLPLGGDVTLDHACRDTGGSSLAECSSSADGNTVDTSAEGPVAVTVTAVDRAGNKTVSTRRFTVKKLVAKPDAAVRGGGTWVGVDKYAGKQRVVKKFRTGATRTVRTRFQNDGDGAAEVRVTGPGNNKKFRVRYLLKKRNVTRQVRGKGLVTELAPGEKISVRVKITRKRAARPGDRRRIRMTVRTVEKPSAKDSIVIVAKARR